MGKYEFLSLCKFNVGDRVVWNVGIYPSSIGEWLTNFKYIHKEGNNFIIDYPADALMALSAMGFELKATTLYNHGSTSSELLYFQRKID